MEWYVICRQAHHTHPRTFPPAQFFSRGAAREPDRFRYRKYLLFVVLCLFFNTHPDIGIFHAQSSLLSSPSLALSPSILFPSLRDDHCADPQSRVTCDRLAEQSAFTLSAKR